MAKYSSERIILTWVDNQDVITLTPSAGRRIVLDEFSVNLYYSVGDTPIVQASIVIAHSALDGGGASTRVREPLDPDSVASTTTVESNWTTPPTIIGELVALPLNLQHGTVWQASHEGIMTISQNSNGRISFRMRNGSIPTPAFLKAECAVTWDEF